MNMEENGVYKGSIMAITNTRITLSVCRVSNNIQVLKIKGGCQFDTQEKNIVFNLIISSDTQVPSLGSFDVPSEVTNDTPLSHMFALYVKNQYLHLFFLFSLTQIYTFQDIGRYQWIPTSSTDSIIFIFLENFLCILGSQISKVVFRL